MYRDTDFDAPLAPRSASPDRRREQRTAPSAEPTYRVEIHHTLSAVDRDAWDQVTAGGTLFLQRRFLAALAAGAGGSDVIEFRYAQLYDGERPVGAACFQCSEFLSQPIGPLLAKRSPLVASIATRLGLVQEPFSLRVLVCGSAFTAGEHGFALVPSADPRRAIASLAAAADQIRSAARGGAALSGVLFKDFYPASLPTSDRLGAHGYCALPSEPNMLLAIDPAWRSYADYLAALSSKFRVKAKRAYAKSAALVRQPLDAAAMERHADRLRALLDAVLARADHRLRCPGVDGLASLRRELGDELILDGYFLDDELVGFASALIDGDTLEAHLVGFDYGLNREHAIYSRILYDYVEHALARGCARLNYGRTAGEMKSTIGAVPVEMTLYVRHRRGTINRLLPTLARAIEPARFPRRRPFKQAWYDDHHHLGSDLLGPPRIAVA